MILYNLFLSIKYNAYINIEIYINVKVYKYIFKYIYKNSDRASLYIVSKNNINDIIDNNINKINKI